MGWSSKYIGVSQNRETPKMDGENTGKPYFLMDDLGENHLFLGNSSTWSIALSLLFKSSPSTRKILLQATVDSMRPGSQVPRGPSRKFTVVHPGPNPVSSWWFHQSIWKITSQIGSSPQVGMKIQNDWNHHLGVVVFLEKTRWLLSFSNFISPFLSHFWW